MYRIRPNKPDIGENESDVSDHKPEGRPDVNESVVDPKVQHSYGAIIEHFAATVNQPSYLYAAIICFTAVIIALGKLIKLYTL